MESNEEPREEISIKKKNHLIEDILFLCHYFLECTFDIYTCQNLEIVFELHIDENIGAKSRQGVANSVKIVNYMLKYMEVIYLFNSEIDLHMVLTVSMNYLY